VGLLDWTDVALGDPALDLVVPALWQGWRFLDDVLGHYRVRLDDGFGDRLRFVARVLSLIWLSESREQATDVPKHLRWVRNAFAASAGAPGPRGS
jgi:aminoglycoside phosphotransferase (APT) family kinase protein